MTKYPSHSKVSTLGPANTNSHHAARLFMETNGIEGEPILTKTAEDSFDLLVKDSVTFCVVCNLYPDIHKLYIPHLTAVTACDVFLYYASMGLFKRPDVGEIHSVAAPITSTVFVKDHPFRVIIADSNAKAAIMCNQGEVDAAVGTKEALEGLNLEVVEDYGTFTVPYTVFKKK